MASAVRSAQPAAGDVQALLQHAVDEAVRLLRSDGAIINLLEPDEGLLRWSHDAGTGSDSEQEWLRSLELRVGEGVFGRAVEIRDPVVTGDYLADRSFRHAPDVDEFATRFGVRSVVVAPLISHGNVLGALGAYSAQRDAFDDAGVGLIRALADHAAAAIVNARLIHQLTRSREELANRVEALRSLREIAARITAVRDGPTILRLVVDESRRLLCSDGAHLTLMAEDRSALVPVVVAGGDEEDGGHGSNGAQGDGWLTSMRFPLDGGINGLAASSGRAVWTPDYLVDPRLPHEPDDVATAERLGLRAVAVAPLRAPGGEVIGTLAVSYAEPRAVIGDDELDLLQGLADQAAIVVTNIRLDDQLRASEERYRYLVEHSPDLVWSTDADGRFTFLSETSERVTGWRPDELIGQHFSAVIHPDAMDEVARGWSRLVADPAAELRARFRTRHRDGRTIVVELHGVAITADGRFAGAHGSVRDVSDHERLERDLRRQAAELATGEERALLARELHDSVTQALFSMTLTTRSIELQLERDPAAAAQRLVELRELQRDALAEMRALIFELRPGSLERDGLVQALRTHAAAVEGRTGISILTEMDEIDRLAPATEGALYRIAQEALHNTVKHARARQVRLRLSRAPEGRVRLTIHDDGIGFDTDAVVGDGIGLAGMRARAERAGGVLEIRSTPGEGTHVEVEVPADSVRLDPPAAAAASRSVE